MTIGIFGGSFNPVHIGHMMLASYIRQYCGIDEVWLTLSPLNPLKADSRELIPDISRLRMLEIAVGDTPGLDVCDIELSMPRPSYTINTLRYLKKRFPGRDFKLIIGSDNWKVFDRWREADAIKEDFGVIVYPRPGYPVNAIYEDNVDLIQAPVADISSTFIRNALARGRDMRYFLPPGVQTFIKDNHLYGT